MKKESVKLNKREAQHVSKIYGEYAENMYKLIAYNLYSKNEDNIFECLQETFIRLIEKFREVLNVANIKAWLYKTAINISYNFNRKVKHYYDMNTFMDFSKEDNNVRLSTLSVEDRYIEDNTNVGEMISQVYFKMNEILTDDQKELYALKYSKNMSNREISKLLNRNEKTVSYHLGIMKGLVFKCVKEVMNDEKLQMI